MNKSLKKYSNIFKQIKDCKYPDITIEIDDYPLYNRSNVHIIIKDKNNPWYSKYVTSSQCPYYKALCEEELQRYIKNARQFLKRQRMKKIFIFLVAMACLTSCKEQFSNGERVGTVTKFSKAGVFWDSWDGLLNVTQTGMNSSGEPFAFSMDNDRNDQQKLIDTLVKAQVEGWKIKIKYHQVWGCKNVFKNRGESDYFVDDVIILDKNFSKIGDIVKGTNKTVPHDTLYVKIVK